MAVRAHYREELDEITAELVRLAGAVGSAMSTATAALLDVDVALADDVIGGDRGVDAGRDRVEQRCFRLLVRQQPVAGDLRTITTAMRTADDLERMGDLAVHVAKLARMRFPDPVLPSSLQPLFADAGRIADGLVAGTAAAIGGRDLRAAAAVEAEDDRMDALHRRLFQEVLRLDATAGVAVAIDVTLLGRYYERFADHAVSVVRRVVFLVTGERDAALVPPGR